MKANVFVSIGPDILALIIVLVAALFGWYKGFIKSAVQFVGNILIIVLVFFISQPISVSIYQGVAQDQIKAQLTRNIQSADVETLGNQISNAIKEMPYSVDSFLKNAGVDDPQDIVNIINDKLDGTKEGAVKAVMENVIDPVFTFIIRGVVFLILLLIGFGIVGIVSTLLSKVINIAGIEKYDKMLGTVFGVLQGVIFVAFLAMVISVFINVGLFKSDWMEKSRIVQFVDQINPISNAMENTVRDIFSKIKK